MESVIAALKKAFLFRDVPDPVLKLVAASAEETSVAAGETILSSATPDALYVIRSGTVRVTPEGGRATPVFFGTGETVGEVPFLDGESVGVVATALERVDLLVIRSPKLQDALAGHPEAGYQLYRAIARSLAGRLRRAVGMIAIAKEG
jgi:CRP-like cAMP-binding protein